MYAGLTLMEIWPATLSLLGNEFQGSYCSFCLIHMRIPYSLIYTVPPKADEPEIPKRNRSHRSPATARQSRSFCPSPLASPALR